MNLNQILISFILILLLIIWYYIRKEHFDVSTSPQTKPSQEEVEEEVEADNMGQIEIAKLITYHNVDHDMKAHKTYNDLVKEGVMPTNSNKDLYIQFDNRNNIYFYKMNINSTITINKNNNIIKSFGFWTNNKVIGKFLTITLGTNKNISFVKAYKSIKIYVDDKYERSLRLNDYKFYWLFFNITNGILEVNLNNETLKKIDVKTSNAITSIKFSKMNGYLGNILVYNKNHPTTSDEICKQYYCYKNIIKDCTFKLKDNIKALQLGNNSNADDCINYCFNKYSAVCNIKQCQKICIGCLDHETQKPIDNIIEQNKYCPWYNNIRSDPTPPSAPKIRGFSMETKDQSPKPYILLEWRKPSHNLSKIVNYIIEIKDILYKHSTDIILIDTNVNKDVYQKQIHNLKPKTTYEINVRAIGEFLELNKNDNISTIGPKSNTINITTKGNNSILSDVYGDINKNYKPKNYSCNRKYSTSDHILDKLNSNDIDLYKYAKSIQ